MQNGYWPTLSGPKPGWPSAKPELMADHLPVFGLDSLSVSIGRAALRFESELEFGEVEPVMMLMRPG
jgi:hypothetical protein